MPATKIATCCYCGTRAALRLKGHDRHELACASCGAPLRDLKMLPQKQAPVAGLPRRTGFRDDRVRSNPKRPAKRRKMGRFYHKLWEELWDELEDIFD